MYRYGNVAALTVLALLAACQNKEAQLPSRANFKAAVDNYLAQRGHLCIAKYDWPIDVGGAAATLPAREYALTAEGQKFYVPVPVVVATAGEHVTHAADLCVAKLALDRVLGWERPMTIDGRTVSSVLFTYRIVDPAPWARSPDVRRAFPMLMRAIDNAGTLQLRLGVHLTPQGWIADELSPETSK